MSEAKLIRRPSKTRNARWAKKIAIALQKLGFTPNVISIMSVWFALLAGTVFFSIQFFDAKYLKLSCYLLAALLIQLRLLCNLFDGMVAVEGNLKSNSGEIYNDFPDRLSDMFIIVGVGYSITYYHWGYLLGWSAGYLAILTAYSRVLGHSSGTKQYFMGPMAKPHRMALITAAAITAGIELFFTATPISMLVALFLLMLGAVITIIRRLKAIVKELEHD
jgi:phosphatidylglycerophosphate synthase